MRLIILTSSRFGTAARCLPALCSAPGLTVAKIVLAQPGMPNRTKALKRVLKKVLKIGFAGALNGARMRDWYRETTEDVCLLAQRFNVPLVHSPFTNCEETRRLFREVNPDIGLSLGNQYIAASVFSIPKYGMINLHCEILPAFRGAQAVIWPIFEGIPESGFTIHQIDSKIDTGEILFQKRVPILFQPTLRATVEKTMESVRPHIPGAFVHVCQNYLSLKKDAKSQGQGKSYTTPSFWQFLRMRSQNKRFWQQSLRQDRLVSSNPKRPV